MSWILKFIKPVILWYLNTGFNRWVVLSVLPKLRFSNTYTKLSGVDYRKAYDRLRPGDIILTTDKANISTKIVGGLYTHALFCVAKDPSGDNSTEIVEMVGEGFKEADFYSISKQADELAIIRCEDFDQEYISKMIDKAFTFRGTPYDVKFEFESGYKALYCSELVYDIDFEHRLDVSLEDVAGLGRRYISPTGLFKARNGSIILKSAKVL